MSTPNDVHVHSEVAIGSCPFCGRDNIACWWMAEGWAIKCMNCGITITRYVSRQAAVAAWNRRPDVGHQARVVKLESAVEHLAAELDRTLAARAQDLSQIAYLEAALDELREAAAPFVDDGNTADCRDYVTVAVDYAEHARLLAAVTGAAVTVRFIRKPESEEIKTI